MYCSSEGGLPGRFSSCVFGCTIPAFRVLDRVTSCFFFPVRYFSHRSTMPVANSEAIMRCLKHLIEEVPLSA